jgi:hypothetical protein
MPISLLPMSTLSIWRISEIYWSVDYTPPSLALDFKDKTSFESAKQNWKWVNDNNANHLFMIANHPNCGQDASRTPYRITKIKYDSVKYIAYMDAVASNYESIVRDGHLRVELDGAVGSNLPRDISINPHASVSKSLSLKKDFSGNIWKTGSGANIATLDCTDCGTDGSVKVILDVTISWFSVKPASIEFQANSPR